VPALALLGSDGESHDLERALATSRATVITFFSATCPCQRAHDERLRALHAKYAPVGVNIVAIDSEADSSIEVDKMEAERRKYPFPILSDPRGATADALGAEYATHSVLVDTKGAILYRGGLDSDKNSLHSDATFYLRDAIEQWLSGKQPDPREAKTLGCSLRRK
jgi:peroxiredoxin